MSAAIAGHAWVSPRCFADVAPASPLHRPTLASLRLQAPLWSAGSPFPVARSANQDVLDGGQAALAAVAGGLCAAAAGLARPRAARPRRRLGGSQGRFSRCSRSAVTAEPPTRQNVLQKVVRKPSKTPDLVPQVGDLVSIDYVGTFEDGTVFDSSFSRNAPFEFIVGETEVIDGWDMLIPSMAKGEKAELVIPPEYAYGEDGIDPVIPPNATLFYQVELLDILEKRKADGSKIDEEEEDDDEVDAEEVQPPTAFLWEKDPNRGGGSGPGYSWQEMSSGKEVRISIPLEEDVTAKDLKVDMRTFSVKCQVKDEVLIDGDIFAEIDMDESFWDFETRGEDKYVLLYMHKMDQNLMWTKLFKGKPRVGGGKAKPKPVVAEVNTRPAARQGGRGRGKSGGAVIDTDGTDVTK